MSSAPSDDLLILASSHAEYYPVLQRFGETASLEVRLDRRRGERRRAANSAVEAERRAQDRRSLDIDEELRVMGWALIPAAQR